MVWHNHARTRVRFVSGGENICPACRAYKKVYNVSAQENVENDDVPHIHDSAWVKSARDCCKSQSRFDLSPHLNSLALINLKGKSMDTFC